MQTFLVTATPPTPNGELHVGHLSGPYLAADVFCRYQRMQGNRAVYLCSSDDHQSYTMTTATRRGCTPAELAERQTQVIKSTLRAAHIELDLYTSALSNKRHIDFVQNFVKELYSRGLLLEKTKTIYYCKSCEHYLFESFIKGGCPFCGEEAAGNLCEACGRINDPIDLQDPICSMCHTTPSLTTYQGLFFPLEAHREAMAQFYASQQTWRPHLQALCQWLVSHPLPDYPVSYPTAWGIPVPLEGFPNQSINVWFEMYPGHIATTQAWAELQGDPALADRLWGGEGKLVQFLGYDNSFFNAVLHVALALALEGQHILPEHIITNEFYLLDGEKFSTSRNHAIWGQDILHTVNADALRYHLSRTNPEHMQTNFSYQEFTQLVERELVERWEPMLNGFLRCVHQTTAGRVPALTDLDLQAIGLLGWAKGWLEQFYDPSAFSLRQASEILNAYAEGCADYLERSVLPLQEKEGETYRQRLASLAYLMQGFAHLAAPLLPAFSQQLWATLGGAGEISEQPWSQLDRPSLDNSSLAPVQEWFQSVQAEPQPVPAS